ncbi:MAG TPA: GNAT family N-acetyltransferase [Candidatus Angelobacter sp.]|nr:GNAT family N-acetyltransferase [Candidatus Angelobacter sp.]
MTELASIGGLSPIEKLTPEHRLYQFSCGNRRVDSWLKKRALPNQVMLNSPQTYVVHCGGRVVAYYALVVGEVTLEKCPPRVAEGMPNTFPVPVIKLVWLGVDEKYQRRGLATALMKDAFLRTLQVAELAGVRAIFVDAIDADAKAMYEKKFGFESSPVGDNQLFLRLDDIRASIDAANKSK